MDYDDMIVQKYLANKPSDAYKNEWFYDNGRRFDEPSPQFRIEVSEMLEKFIEKITNYTPSNETFINSIFPNFYAVIKKTIVLFVVGLKDPYDMMMLEHNKRFYVIIDLIRLLGYGKNTIFSVHEFIHVCVHEHYPEPEKASYKERLDYIAFDEGFAHVLGYMEQNPHRKLLKISKNVL
jgi:hypothetical protein